MSRSQAQVANEQVVSQVQRKKIGPGNKATGNASRVSSLLQSGASTASAHGMPPASGQLGAAWPEQRTVTFAPSKKPQKIEEDASGSGGAQPVLLPSQLLQQGVQSMGGALEVSPSAFGGFTVREDFVGAMRLNMSQARSMPAEGEGDCQANVQIRHHQVQALFLLLLMPCQHTAGRA
jgi:hypothetical protein